MIYVVTFENDGDFPECEIVLVTTSYLKAIEKAKLRPNTYALSIVWEWEGDSLAGHEVYDSDSVYPDTSKMREKEIKETIKYLGVPDNFLNSEFSRFMTNGINLIEETEKTLTVKINKKLLEISRENKERI